MQTIKEGGLRVCWPGLAFGSEEVVLRLAELPDDRFGLLHQGSLGEVLAEGLVAAFHDGAHIEGNSPGCGHGGGPALKEEAGCQEIEAVGVVDGTEFRVALAGGRPVVGSAGECRDHGVIGMRVDGAVGSEGNDDVGLEGADLSNQGACGDGEVRELQLPVPVAEQLIPGDAKHVAGCGELPSARPAEVVGRGGRAAIGGGLPVGETDHAGFHAVVGGECERAAEGEAFVVGVRDDAHQP